MIQYKSFELHNHTLHSDGDFTVPELCQAAKDYGYDAIALTDHNTIAGWDDITEDTQAVMPIIKGIEWTTFFGHMLVLCAESYIDWQYATPDNIDEHLRAIKNVKGVVGIAHGKRVGSPMCTGCHWEFNVKDWNLVDYIEIWSEPAPSFYYVNDLAIQMWTDLLNEGWKIAISSGRDWHRKDTEVKPVSTTYLGLKDGEINESNVRDAIENGRTFLTMGPSLTLHFSDGEKIYGIGDVGKPNVYQAQLSLDLDVRKDIWNRFGLVPHFVKYVHNGITLATLPLNGQVDLMTHLNLEKGWIRLELYGEYQEHTDVLLAITSPYYIE